MVKMIAETRFFLHAGDKERLKLGEEFETTAENAADLKVLGRARYAPNFPQQIAAKVVGQYRRRDMRAEK